VSAGAGATYGGGRLFDAQEVVIALAVAMLAQLLFVLAFSLPSPKLVEAEISNENAQPIAVAITPVLKLGSKNPTSMPKQWQRRKPPPPTAAKQEPAALPSPQADKTPQAIPTTHVPDASVAPMTSTSAAPQQPNVTAPADSSAVATAASTQGSEQGAENGTETDPLKARAADMYRAQLMSWFANQFHIRGKIPFDKLKTLHAATVVTITPDRRVGGFSITRPSGDPTFDSEVQSTLAHIQGSGAELPAPPPMYPDMLRQSLPVGFSCTIRAACE
jgi:outer membrane biosynthesis protein TonB